MNKQSSIRIIVVSILLVMLALASCQAPQQKKTTLPSATPSEDKLPTMQPNASDASSAPQTADEETGEVATTPSLTAPENASKKAVMSNASATNTTNGTGRHPGKYISKDTYGLYTPPPPKVYTGIVTDLLMTREDRTTGYIKVDGQTFKIPFETALRLKRYEKVRFELDIYNNVYNLERIVEKAAPMSGQSSTSYKGPSTYKEGDNTIVIGIVHQIRSVRVGDKKRYVGLVKPLESFATYPFTTNTEFELGVRVKLILDDKLLTVNMTRFY